MVAKRMLAEWFWIDRWTGSDAFLLPLEARGLHREMLTQAWGRGGRLPKDHEAIRRACGITEAEWSRCWPPVSKFWRVDGEHLVNDDQLEVYEEALTRAENASRRASSAARAKQEQRRSTQAPAQAGGQAPAQAQPEDSSSTPQELPSISISDLSTRERTDTPSPKATITPSPSATVDPDSGQSYKTPTTERSQGRQLRDYYHVSFKAKYGTDPEDDVSEKAKHGSHFKRLVKRHGLATMKLRLDAYFASHDPFIVDHRHSLNVFFSNNVQTKLVAWMAMKNGSQRSVTP